MPEAGRERHADPPRSPSRDRTSVARCGIDGLQTLLGKPSATAEQFNRDSTECAKEASPTPIAASYGIGGSERIYKGCMRSRGWAREKKPDPPGEGWFRGIEDWD